MALSNCFRADLEINACKIVVVANQNHLKSFANFDAYVVFANTAELQEILSGYPFLATSVKQKLINAESGPNSLKKFVISITLSEFNFRCQRLYIIRLLPNTHNLFSVSFEQAVFDCLHQVISSRFGKIAINSFPMKEFDSHNIDLVNFMGKWLWQKNAARILQEILIAVHPQSDLVNMLRTMSFIGMGTFTDSQGLPKPSPALVDISRTSSSSSCSTAKNQQGPCTKQKNNAHCLISVTNLPEAIDVHDLFKIFSRFGPVDKDQIKFSKRRLLALVPFLNRDDAKKLLKTCDGTLPIRQNSHRLIINATSGKKKETAKVTKNKNEVPTGTTNACGKNDLNSPTSSKNKPATPDKETHPTEHVIRVSNLPADMITLALFQIFSQYGPVNKTRITYNKSDHTATIPFVKEKSVADLMEKFKGVLPIRQNRHTVLFEPLDSKWKGVKSDVTPQNDFESPGANSTRSSLNSSCPKPVIGTKKESPKVTPNKNTMPTETNVPKFFAQNDLNSPPGSQTEYVVRVANLPEDITMQALYQIFSRFGPVDESRITYKKADNTATIPFLQEKSIEKLVQEYKGNLPIRQKKHTILFEPLDSKWKCPISDMTPRNPEFGSSASLASSCTSTRTKAGSSTRPKPKTANPELKTPIQKPTPTPSLQKTTTMYSFPQWQYEFLSRCVRNRMDSIITAGNSTKFQFNDVRQEISFSATPDTISLIRNTIYHEILIRNNLSQLELKANFQRNYLSSDSGRGLMRKIGDATSTVIFEEPQSKCPEATRQNVDLVLAGKFQNLDCCIISGLISSQKIDCIVNVTNMDLNMTTNGLGVSILSKGGDMIKQECLKYIATHGPLSSGQHFVSGAGKLSCKNIIHVVYPSWMGGDPKQESAFRCAVFDVVEKAHRLGAKSIAFPTVSSKSSGYPLEKATPIIVGAALEAAVAMKLEKLAFVDSRKNALQLLVQSLQAQSGFVEGKADQLLNEGSDRAAPSTQPVDGQKLRLPLVKISSSLPPTAARSGGAAKNSGQSDSNARFVASGCEVDVVFGDMVNLAANYDAIVNSTGRNFIDGGNSSRAVLDAAGPRIRDEIQKSYPHGISSAQHAVSTGAYDLGCKWIVHVCMPDFLACNCDDDIGVRIRECLSEACALKCEAVAFPALGTGQLGYPAAVTAKFMFKHVESWLKNHNVFVKLKRVSFVIFPSDMNTVKAFENEYKVRLPPTVPNPMLQSIQPVLINYQIEHVKVQFSTGNIVDQVADVVLSSRHASSSMQLDQAMLILSLNANQSAMAVYDVKNVLQSQRIIVWPVDPRISLVNFHEIQHKQLSKALSFAEMSGFYHVALQLNCMAENLPKSFPLNDHLKTVLSGIQNFLCSKSSKALHTISIMVDTIDDLKKVDKFIDTTIGSCSKKPSNNLFSNCFERAHKSVMDMFPMPAEDSFQKKCSDQGKKFSIYGLPSDIENARIELNRTFDTNWPWFSFMHYSAEYLKPNDLKLCQDLAQQLGLEFEFLAPQNLLKFRGPQQSIFEKAVKAIMQKFHEELTNVDQSVQWFKKTHNGHDWSLITQNSNLLEKAYQEKCATINVFESVKNAKVDFEDMVVFLNGALAFQLKRRNVTDDIPVHWTCSNSDILSVPKLVPLDPMSQEYRDISAPIARSCPTTRIKQIERIENPSYYRRYMIVKKELEVLLAGTKFSAETKLYHGTADVNVATICALGFNRSLAGANANLYGSGSYFARQFAYSKQYGRKVLLSLVLTGRYCRGSGGLKTAPSNPELGLPFDSVVDNPFEPNIFVVFTDNHAYPAYVITVD